MLLAEMLDLLENGDVAEDFENVPYVATEIRMLADIIRGRLNNAEEAIEWMSLSCKFK